MDAAARIVRLVDVAESSSPQAQALTPMVTAATTGTAGISGGRVRMPPNGMSKPHLHIDNEIIVVVLAGHAATLVWEDDGPRALVHGPGEMCYVPAGVPHCAVNLSADRIVLALSFRTDPAFNDDVKLLPELDEQAARLSSELRRSHVASAHDEDDHLFAELQHALLTPEHDQR